MVWEDMQLGPAHSARPDVFTMRKSFTDPRPLVYEVKVSAADYRSDITTGKWQRYLEFSTGVIFAAPAGMIAKADLPRGCGLITRGDNGWHTVKAPTRQVCKLPERVLLKLLIDGIDRERAVQAHKRQERYTLGRAARETLAEDVRAAVHDAEALRTQIDHHRSLEEMRAKQLRENAQRDAERAAMAAHNQLQALREACGLAPDCSPEQIRRAADALLAGIDRDPAIGAARNKARWLAQSAQALWDQLENMGKDSTP